MLALPDRLRRVPLSPGVVAGRSLLSVAVIARSIDHRLFKDVSDTEGERTETEAAQKEGRKEGGRAVIFGSAEQGRTERKRGGSGRRTTEQRAPLTERASEAQERAADKYDGGGDRPKERGASTPRSYSSREGGREWENGKPSTW